jgi:hypothetical protein
MQLKLKMLYNRNNWSLAVIRLYKQLSSFLKPNNHKPDNKILIILGCQRSGTSLIYWIFERDLNTKIYREKSRLNSRDPKGLRLNPYHVVLREFSRYRRKLIVFKPLAESQNANTLLSRISKSRILWMYRHYNDVAASNLKAFGRYNGIADLLPIVQNQKNNWRCQNMSSKTQSIIRRNFSSKMNPFDAAALFWYTRNQLFFEKKLDLHDDVLLCRYEDLVKCPETVMKIIYCFVGCRYPGNRIIKGIHSESVGKGRSVSLSPHIADLCEELLSRLNKSYITQKQIEISNHLGAAFLERP